MKLLVLFLASAVLELLVIGTPLIKRRPLGLAWLACLLIMLSSVASLLLVNTWLSYLLISLNCYRIINIGRVVERRMHQGYLEHVVRRTAVRLWVAGLIICVVNPAFGQASPWLAIALAQVVAAIIFMVTIRRQFRTTQYRMVEAPPRNQLPTVTVAIPARNETQALLACLQSVIASDYPKLEVLVLDDNSTNPKTSEIIRGFAHDGVRFIPGQELRPNWLPKNWAYQQLAKEANGDIILFCGVDMHFASHSISQLVAHMQAKQKRMLCCIPRNGGDSLVQPMRYVWELALPRRLFHRPAVLSSCWLIQRTALSRIGGFAAVTRMIVPEAFLACELGKLDAYSLLRGNDELGVTSHKSAHDQWLTAIRTRYPQLHKRIELVWLYSVTAIVIGTLPLVLTVYSYAKHHWLVGSLSLLAALVQYIAYAWLLNGHFAKVRTTFLLPISVAYDVFLLNRSLWRYEFGRVLWRGRDVVPAVMHQTPHVPQL